MQSLIVEEDFVADELLKDHTLICPKGKDLATP